MDKSNEIKWLEFDECAKKYVKVRRALRDALQAMDHHYGTLSELRRVSGGFCASWREVDKNIIRDLNRESLRVKAEVMMKRPYRTRWRTAHQRLRKIEAAERLTV